MRAGRQNIFLIFFSLFVCLTLSSCGFHLRGPVPLAPPLKQLYLKTEDPYGQLTRNIKQYLKLSGVYLANTPQEAETVLVILREFNSEQLLSIGGTQQTRQYNITLTVNFEVTTPDGKILVSPQSCSETRALTIQSNQILGGSNEENNLYQQMRRAIVYDIMSRLSSKEVSTLVTQPVVTPQLHR